MDREVTSLGEIMAFIINPDFPVFKRKPLITFEDAAKTPHTFCAGLYVFIGGTGKGKSLSSVALAIAIGDQLALPANYVHCNEATGHMMSAAHLKDTLMPTCSGQLLVVDSVTDLFLELKNESGTTFAKGLIPEHIKFVRTLQMKAYEQNVVLIAIVNTDQLPIGTFEGATEGAIQIAGANLIRKRDRKLRYWADIRLDPAWVKRAATVLNYDESYTNAFEGATQNLNYLAEE